MLDGEEKGKRGIFPSNYVEIARDTHTLTIDDADMRPKKRRKTEKRLPNEMTEKRG